MIETAEVKSPALTDQIRKAVEQGRLSLPPLPELLTKLNALLADEARTGAKRVAQLVRNDPAVAAAVLRMANSAFFGGLHPISDLSQAIARIGFRQVTSVVTALAHGGHFESKDPRKREMLQCLWGHAVTTALAAKRLAAITGGDPEQSFIAGLLHDVGKLLVLKHADHIEATTRSVSITGPVLAELMDVLHTEMGHRILVAWHLPEEVATVALRHHDDPEGADLLVVRVQAADAVARKMGEHPTPDPGMDLLHVPAVEQLNLRDIELASLMVDLEDQIADIKSLVQHS